MTSHALVNKLAWKARAIYRRVTPAKLTTQTGSLLTGQAAAEIIAQRIRVDRPLMVARFGATEMQCIASYRAMTSGEHSYWRFIRGKSPPFWWAESTLREMPNNAGFFPATPASFERFAQLMIADMPQVDILGSWQPYERIFDDELHNAVKVAFEDLEPFYLDNPWSAALEHRKVLVVHPFAESIAAQYPKRRMLFSNPKILPDFELLVLRAVQSGGGGQAQFPSWFDALDHMKEQINSLDFEVAIIGCGAYGFPLAAHIKRMGKKAIHLGGVTQILFGIKGKRWESEPRISPMFNRDWVRPLPSEKPPLSNLVEGGTYW